MSIGIKIKKGLDLRLEGAVADTGTVVAKPTRTVAITPDDFTGLVPKMEVREGDTVLAGQPLFHDKVHDKLKVVSPAAGTVKAVVRGERRKILKVVVEVTGENSVTFPTAGVLSDAGKARELLLNSGLWAMMSQRPYAIVPNPAAEIRDIFVCGFDSAPLATAPQRIDAAQLEAGVKLLSLITKGKVYVSHRDNASLADIKGAEMVNVAGPHPSGNAGTLIAAIKPVNKGETVISLDINTLQRIGATALTGHVPFTTIIALTGSEVKQPKLISCLIGAEMSSLLSGEIKEDGRHHRIISGNVLTGIATTLEGYLHYPYRHVTVIPEGDDVDEFMGWASFSPKKMSVSPSFPGHFLHSKLFNPDARLQGGRRAMIMSGEYDKMMPLDILPEYLIKAILSRDIDRMEQLGIYEVAPEDFALAEYADTSKLELQKIVREGLDYLRKELE